MTAGEGNGGDALLKPPRATKIQRNHTLLRNSTGGANSANEDNIDPEEETNQMVLPFEVLIEQRHQALFLKAWDIYGYRLKYSEFVRVLGLLLGDPNSKEWITSFLQRQITKNYFESLPILDQIDFIKRLVTAFSMN